MKHDIKQQDWTTVAEIELVYRTKCKPSERPKVRTSHDAYELLLQTWDINQLEFVEEFKILLLNRALSALGVVEVSKGTTVGCLVDPKLVLVAAIKSNATNVILCHNHPSGCLSASQNDKLITKKLQAASSYHDFNISDHLIITKESYLSFADEGLL